MRLSKSFWQTFKEAPKEAQIPSHVLMIRAGLIHKASGGLYNYLPMGQRVIQKISDIVREEHDKEDCQQITMTVVTPGELWQETGRWGVMGELMLKMKDRAGRDLCMSPTNEEAVVDIFRSSVKSYKQLPQTLYQINTKFRDEIRPRYGVMRAREFLMKDAYSFHLDKACLDEGYDKMYRVYENIFKRIGLAFIAVEADGGAIAGGGAKTHEFQVLARTGEDKVIRCKQCGYAANLEKAVSAKRENRENKCKASDKNVSLEMVETPSCTTIEDVCRFLKVEESASLKSLVYYSISGDIETPVLVILVGDDQLNEIKLQNYLKANHLKAASDGEIERLGLVKGYIGPQSLTDIKILIDSAVALDNAYVSGANKSGYHSKGMIPNRDCKNFDVVDLRLAGVGDVCTRCGGEVEEIRGIETGHIFQLGDKYTKDMKVQVLDKSGKGVHPLMGCYGIGVSRIVAAAIEQNFDDNGIVWPKSIAPYHVYFCFIGKSQEIKELAHSLYQSIKDSGVEVVLDDRGAGPGFMFNDADLLGLPLRVILGERDYNNDGLIEIKERKSGKVHKATKDQLISKIKEILTGIN